MLGFYKAIRYLQQRNIKRKLRGISRFFNCSHATIPLVISHCSSSNDTKNHIKFPDSSQLSHEQLIQQACTATVNSSSQLLTCTLVAIIDIGQKYRKALNEQLSLLEDSLSDVGNEALQEDLTDLITAARSNVDTFRRNFVALDSLMEYVEKLVNSTTETSFLAGAETACIALSERLHSAKTMISEEKRLIKQLEEELVQLQQKLIQKTSDDKSNNQ